MQTQQNYPGTDFTDLLFVFWKQKKLVLLITSICLAISGLYILFATPGFEAKGYISPPMPGDIAPLNYGRSNLKGSVLKPYKINEIYNIFVNNLLSESTKRSFFNDVYLPSVSPEKKSHHSQDVLFKSFSKILSIKEAQRSGHSHYIVIVKGVDPEQDVLWVKKYIDLAKQQAFGEILADITHQCKSIARDLRGKISMAREVVKNQRQDRVLQLKEAIKIAQAVGLENQSISSLNGTLTDATVMNLPTMMYLRGTKALLADLDNLSSRGSDDPFVSNLREMQSQLNFYKNMIIKMDKVAVFRLDGEIEKPDLPTTPMKSLIMGLTLLAGLVLSALVIMIRRSLIPVLLSTKKIDYGVM